MIDPIQTILNNPYVFGALLIWSLIIKGLALWRAARLKQAGWYIALLIVNTVGLFEIIYLIATSRKYREMNGIISDVNSES
ncbi:MAG: DUF5652 family protein [Eubacteriales bacterium]|nr:DUF5652 family protein [Eubacteriales bacterium]